MEHFGILISLIGVMFISIIGVYVWTMKIYKFTETELAKILAIVNSHLQNANIHRDEARFVSAEVCNALHIASKEKMDTLARNQTAVIKDLNVVMSDVKLILSKVNGK